MTITKQINMPKVSALLTERDALNRRIEQAMIEELTLGSTIAYERGDNTIYATVIGLGSYSQRVQVRGKTGREYWLNLPEISGVWRKG